MYPVWKSNTTHFADTPQHIRSALLEYTNAISHPNEPTFDVVFVDGRARMACALKALAFIHSESRVIIHDWSRYRSVKGHEELFEHFQVVEEIKESPAVNDSNGVLQQNSGIGVLQPKPGSAGKHEAFESWIAHQTDSDWGIPPKKFNS